jgi:3-phytase/alkaline phosphatase D
MTGRTTEPFRKPEERTMPQPQNKTFALSLLPLLIGAAFQAGPSHASTFSNVTIHQDFNLDAAPATVRFATFNASLNRDASGQLLSDLEWPGDANFTTTVGKRIQQIHNVAETLQRINPDVLLVNEFDFDLNGTPTASGTPMPLGYSSEAAYRFQNNFLFTPHGGVDGRSMTETLSLPYRYTPNTNTGLASGLDLDNNGAVGGGNDAYGFGNFPGQYGMTLYSKHEIVGVRTFQNFLWKDMPGNLLTNDPTAHKLWSADGSGFYNNAEKDALRLSSKNHVDVTVRINGQEVHFLAAHPTPPTFDGTEDRNGKRNHDEIRFWADYINGAGYIYDDQGGTGGLAAGARFVIAGDYNADPGDGDSFLGAIHQLLDDPLVNTLNTPSAPGGIEAATWPDNNGTANQSHVTDPMFDTADFNDLAPGNLRVDYVLPSANMGIEDGGIFWPESIDPNWAIVGAFRDPYNLYANYVTSDHKAVWVDVTINPVPEPEAYALMLAGLGLVGFMARRRAA